MSLIYEIVLIAMGLLAKTLVGENLVVTTLISKGIENIIDESKIALQKRDDQEAVLIEQVARGMIDEFIPFFMTEYGDGNYSAVYYEFMQTVRRSEISAQLLIDLDFQPNQLYEYIKSQTKNRKKGQGFSEKEKSLYQDLLLGFCREIVKIAHLLQDFYFTVSKEQLASLRKILSLLTKIYEKPNHEDTLFEKKYLTELSKHLDKMEMFGIRRVDNISREQRLSIAYINLEIEQKNLVEVKEQDKKRKNRKTRKKSEKQQSKLQRRNTSTDKVFLEGKRFLVLGEPGSGKTTLLKWTAIQICNESLSQDNSDSGKLIPFFIRLRELVDKRFPELEKMPNLALKMIGGKPDQWVHRILDSGRGVILIDGIDELPITDRGDLLQDLSQLVSMYPFARYIITSRPSAVRDDAWIEWKDWIGKENYSKATLQPMNKLQVDVFIDKWFVSLAESLQSEAQDSIPPTSGIKRVLKARPPLYRLSTNPLLCAMICALYLDRGETLPSERIQLYAECVEMLLHKRDEVRKISNLDYPNLPASKWMALAEDLAWWMMENGYSEVDATKAQEYLSKELYTMGITDISPVRVTDFLLERAGLLQDETIGKLSYKHRTFQEYLAAKSAVSYFRLEFLVKQAIDDQWRETIILACGDARPKERGEVLKSLLDLSKNSGAYEGKRNLALLALACLETCIQIEPPDIRKQVVNYAKEFIPPRDRSEAQVLARAGEFAIDLLKYNPNIDNRLQIYCISALVQIGTDAALRNLRDYSQNSDHQVQQVLAEAHIYFDTDEYFMEVMENSLFLIVSNLNNLAPVKYMKNLRVLDVNSSSISDLAPLKEKFSLEYIDIRSTLVSDLGPLSNLKELKYLDIRGTSITDLHALANSKKLKELFLDPRVGHDVSDLIELPDLEIIVRATQKKDQKGPLF